MRQPTDTDVWHTVVLDVDDVPGRRLGETVSGAGFRPEPVTDVSDLQATLETQQTAVAVIAYEALFPLPQRTLRRLRTVSPRTCMVVVHAEHSPRLRLGERMWAMGLMDYFLPRSSPPHVFTPVLRQAFAETLIEDDPSGAAYDPANPPSALRLVTRLSTALMSQRSVPGLLRVLHTKLASFIPYDVLEVLVLSPGRRQLFVFPTQPIEHEVMWQQVTTLCRAVSPLVDGGAIAPDDLEFVEGASIGADGAAPPVAAGGRTVVCFPMVACGETVGCIAVGLLGDPTSIDDMRSILQLVSQHLATALRCVYALEEVEQTSLLDELTGVHNRRYLRRVLDDEWARTARYSLELSIAVLDLDHFKVINDTYGHLAGDEALREFARLVARELRDSDTLARYGGEEFVVVLPQTGAANAARVIDRMRRRVESTPLKIAGWPDPIQLTFSAGVACSPQLDLNSTEELIEKADEALLSAKRAGRNQVQVASRQPVGFDFDDKTEVTGMEREQRRHNRVRIEEAVACLPVLDLDPNAVAFHAVDISEGGVQLDGLPNSLSKDSYTLVYFAGTAQPRLAQVVWTTTDATNNTRAGLKFVSEADLAVPAAEPAARTVGAPRALVVVTHPTMRDIAQRVLRSTRYDTTVATPEEPVDLGRIGEYSLIVVGDTALRAEFGRTLSDARTALNPSLRLVLLNETASRHDLLETIERERVQYLVAKDSNQEEALFTTISKLLLSSYFGIKKYLLWGASTKSWTVKDMHDKNRVFDELRVLAASVQCHPRISDLLIAAVDEMMINAMYLDVPADQRKPITVEYGSDGRLLAVAVIDLYGSFQSDHLYKSLGQSMVQEVHGMPTNATNGNLGMRTMLAALSHLVVNVDPGKRTELIGIVDLRKSLREHRMSAPSLGVFTR